MKLALPRRMPSWPLAMVLWTGVVLLISNLAACGGGGGDSSAGTGGGGSTTPPVVTATTTNVSTKVIDGAIQNAVVCLDKNANGKCDTDETQGTTDATGAVTLAVPNADVGKFPLIAIVGTNAIDADHGPVTVPYTLSAPADQTGVVSPLTTLVQQTIATSGASTADAAKAVQDATGLPGSLFADFTTAPAPTDGGVSAATVARMLVVTTQNQSTAVAATLGTPAADGTTITQADIDKAIQKKLLELLPALMAALDDPAITAAATPVAKDTALQAASTTLVGTSGLTPASVPTIVAINTQTSSAPPADTAAPAASFTLRQLNFTDASNYLWRAYTATTAENTPDANGNTKYVERHTRASGGTLATWGFGDDPTRNADLHWNGSAWVGCPLGFENTNGPRDAQGHSTYNMCDGWEVGANNRASFDIGGKTMAAVYDQVRAAGYTNLNIASSATVLGTATFPTGSTLYYSASTPTAKAFAYYPGGSDGPDGAGNTVTQYSAAVAAGGDATTQATSTGCNSPEAAAGSTGTNSTTLESMIAVKKGTPCVFAAGTLTVNGVSYPSGTPNEWWGNSVISIGKLGNVSNAVVGAGGYYTGNTLLRAAFTGSAANSVTYYACQERTVSVSTRNCKPIGTGTYAIATLGNARVLTMTNQPVQTAALGYDRVLIERGGQIFLGYQNKLTVTNNARLNTVAANALLTQLGVTPADPAVPLILTVGSYQGVWDMRNTTGPFSASNHLILIMFSDGTNSCESATGADVTCTITLNPATGSFVLFDGTGAPFIAGTLDVLTGEVTGNNLTGSRR